MTGWRSSGAPRCLPLPGARHHIPYPFELNRRLRPPWAPWVRTIAAGGALLLAACASQGPPRPPRIEKPERVTDLAVAQIGHALELSFTPPALATDGERLSKPLEIEIFRSVTPPGQKTVDALAAGQPWTTLLGSDLGRFARGRRIVYPSLLPEPEFSRSLGSTFAFAVRGLTRGFRHRPIPGEASKTVEAVLLDVSGPVEGLAVRPTEHALELRWRPPSHTLSGGAPTDLAGYRVYKSQTGKPDSFRLLGETASAAYQDPDFQFKNTYSYKVRAAFKRDGQVAESEDSEAVKITSLDAFPPAPPTGLTGLYTVGQVELIWTANTEPDLAGYNVYRRDDGGPPHRISRALVSTPIFHDSLVEMRHTYAYQVTAVDLAGNESRPSAEVQVQVQ
jgi:hypothetical protein